MKSATQTSDIKAPTLVSSRDLKTQPTPTHPSFAHAARYWLKRIFGQKPDGSLKEALEEIIEEHGEQAQAPLAPEEKVMLHNVLGFGDIKVSDIMTPRTDIAAVAYDVMLPNLKTHIIEQRHTRIPVYQDTLDKMLGFIHVKDLLPMLGGEKAFDLDAVLRPLLFVPPSMRLIDLLIKMRHANSHMAIVVDEYGGTDGLVTMEDVFEEIVGDIKDEHDEDEGQDKKILRISEHVFEASARVRIEVLEKKLGLKLVAKEKEGEFDTLGGLIFFQLGRVPSKGEMVVHGSGIRFEITEADQRRIRKVRIHTA